MRFQLYELGALLHKTIAELGEMEVEEFHGWIAWHRIRNERQDG